MSSFQTYCLWVSVDYSYLRTECVNLSQLEQKKTTAGKKLSHPPLSLVND